MVPSGHPTPRLCAGVPIVEASPPPLPDTHEFQLPQAALSQPGARGPQVHVRAGSRHTANGTWGPSPLVSLRLGSLWLPQAWGWGGQCAVCLEGDWPRVMGLLLEPRAGGRGGRGGTPGGLRLCLPCTACLLAVSKWRLCHSPASGPLCPLALSVCYKTGPGADNGEEGKSTRAGLLGAGGCWGVPLMAPMSFRGDGGGDGEP